MKITNRRINVILILAYAGFANMTTAQNAIPIEEAYTRAIVNSKTAGFYGAVLQLAEAESKLGVGFPFLNTFFEGGQINSALADTKLTISQSGYFPGYHKAYRGMQSARLEMAKTEKQIADWEIKKFIAGLYLQYDYYQQVAEIYNKQDSLYSLAADRARERLKSGETDGIEVMEASAQLTHIQKMKMETTAELNGLINMFRLWMQGKGDEVPDLNSIDIQQWATSSEEEIVVNHPVVKRMDQGIQLANFEAEWKKAQRKPMWTMAISNTSFRGTGADDRKYDASARFTSFQLGLGLPVFGRQVKKVDEIIKMASMKADAEKAMTEAHLKNAVSIQKQRLQLLQNQYVEFEKQSLPLANQLLTIAKNKLDAGEIDFMKYAYMTGQAYALILDHASLKKQLGEAGVDYFFVNQ